MNKNKAKLFLIIVFAMINSPLCAKSSYGTAGAQILNLHTSAKVSSMGDAFAGLANDLNAVIYNPAGLGQLYGTEFQLTRLFYFMDTGVNALTFAQKFNKMGAGIKVKLFSAEDTYRGILGADGDKFKIKYSQYSIGLGRQIFNKHSAGVTVNIVYENFALGSTAVDDDKKDTVMAFDLGWHYRARRGDSFGAVIRNAGGKVRIGEKADRLPLQFVLGGGHKMGRFILVWEAVAGREIPFGWKSGVEADIQDFKVRAGFMYITAPDLTLGFGVPYRNFYLDYAFFPHQALGTAHRITLGGYF